MNKIPQRDPIGVYVRKQKAIRRVGVGAHCACGEDRPEALIRQKGQIICDECKRRKKGITTMDDHHFAGESNSPVTVLQLANDHRSELNPAQYDWPKKVLENPHGSPLLAAAAMILGFIDTVVCMIKRGLQVAADVLVKCDELLRQHLGDKYWIGTPLEVFCPKR